MRQPPNPETTTVVASGTGSPGRAYELPAVLTGAVPEHLLNAKLGDTTGKRLLSRAEFCAFFNISTSTGERWAREAYGPQPVKIGPRRVGYRLADVLAFVETRQNVAA